MFVTVLRDGPPVGIHTIVWCDSVNNLNRTLDRQGMREFENRILFQMSANDSSTLIDMPTASKLGENRALYYSEEENRIEKFRPYGVPEQEWLNQVKARFAARPMPEVPAGRTPASASVGDGNGASAPASSAVASPEPIHADGNGAASHGDGNGHGLGIGVGDLDLDAPGLVESHAPSIDDPADPPIE